jgi:hypothetical protein
VLEYQLCEGGCDLVEIGGALAVGIHGGNELAYVLHECKVLGAVVVS